jgi:hypothetical protein
MVDSMKLQEFKSATNAIPTVEIAMVPLTGIVLNVLIHLN